MIGTTGFAPNGKPIVGENEFREMVAILTKAYPTTYGARGIRYVDLEETVKQKKATGEIVPDAELAGATSQ